MAADFDEHASRFSTAAFLLRLIASIAAPLVLIGAALWWFVARDQVDQVLTARAVTASDLLRSSLGDELVMDGRGDVSVADPLPVDQRVAEMMVPVFGSGTSVRVVGFDGAVLYSTNSSEIGEFTGDVGISSDALRGVASGARVADSAKTEPVDYSVPVALDVTTVATAKVSVPHDVVIADAVDSAGSLVFLFGGALLAMFVALVPLCWWSLGEIRRQFRRTRVLAMNDNLTGLANRTQFHQRLDEAIAGAQRSSEAVGLVMVDLDGFKAINDRGGHAAGDRLLRRVAAALGEVTRRNELACRLGGDEFAVVVPRIKGREELRGLADRLHEQLDLPVEFSDGRTLRVTASLGLALYPEDAANADDLVHVADVGMYTVKASRKAKLPRQALDRATSAMSTEPG